MRIQISYLLDLDLHGLQRQGISRFSRTRVKNLSIQENMLANSKAPGDRYNFKGNNSDMEIVTSFLTGRLWALKSFPTK